MAQQAHFQDFTGFVGDAAKFTQTDDVQRLTFSVCVNHDLGSDKTHEEWMFCVLYGARAKALSDRKAIAKGTYLQIKGRREAYERTNAQSQATEIAFVTRVDNLLFLDRKRDAGAGTEAAAEAKQPAHAE